MLSEYETRMQEKVPDLDERLREEEREREGERA